MSRRPSHSVRGGRGRFAARICALLTAIMLGASPALADVPMALSSAVRIESPTVVAACRDAATTVGFVVVNDSSSRLHLAGLSSNVARQARLKGRVGPGERADLGSISVPADSRVDLLTSHLRYEISPLVRDIRAGEVIEVQLDFVTFKVVVPVHVHEAPKGTAPCAG